MMYDIKTKTMAFLHLFSLLISFFRWLVLCLVKLGVLPIPVFPPKKPESLHSDGWKQG